MADQEGEIIDVLRGRILRGVAAGTLRTGDRLPSARDLAGEFESDYRAVLAAYRSLAGEGLIELRARGGIYVGGGPDGGGASAVPSVDWLVGVLTDGFAREIPAPQLHEWLRRVTETLRLRAFVVSSTHDQVTGLCRELQDDFGFDADGEVAPELSDDDPPLALRRADLLVTTEAHGTRVQRLGEALGRPVIVVEVRPDIAAGELTLLLRRPVYAVVATPEFADMLRRYVAAVPGAENLRILVFGRDDVSAIPDDAPTYVTRRVRESAHDARIPGRRLPTVRTICRPSARELFTFIVRANLRAIEAASDGRTR